MLPYCFVFQSFKQPVDVLYQGDRGGICLAGLDSTNLVSDPIRKCRNARITWQSVVRQAGPFNNARKIMLNNVDSI